MQLDIPVLLFFFVSQCAPKHPCLGSVYGSKCYAVPIPPLVRADGDKRGKIPNTSGVS